MRLDSTLVKIDQFLRNRNTRVPASIYQANHMEESVENCCDYLYLIIYKGKKNRIKVQ